jgi:ribosomal protein S18 acetylase RimI-like enzyme
MLNVNHEPRIATSTPSIPDIRRAVGQQEAEVLDFVSAQPLQTFVMSGWIKDNGLDSQLNRGTFYVSQSERGELNGVALIGHITLFETNSDTVLAAFAELTRKRSDAFVILGEEQNVDRFMSYYAPEGPGAHRTCRELLFAQQSRQSCDTPIKSLRRATNSELDLIVPVHAQMAFEQSGVNPLDVDAQGFQDRCARRIEQGRVWVCVEDGKLQFKADVITDIPEVNYLEGVYVRPEDRGRGFGAACLRQLTNVLLSHTKLVCLMTAEDEHAAQSCYSKAGYRMRE